MDCLSPLPCSDADIVIEAGFEDMAVKKQIFAQLDKACKPDAILASNTSYLDIDEIARATARPTSVIGMHFFSPANIMQLLEVVRGPQTASAVIQSCMALGKKLKKTPVLAGNCFGFIGNRMLDPYIREAQLLVEEGASPAQVGIGGGWVNNWLWWVGGMVRTPCPLPISLPLWSSFNLFL